MVSYISLGHADVRVELVAVTPTGPYRLEVDHPEKKIVEYFDTPFAALMRHAEIEAALRDNPHPTRPRSQAQADVQAADQSVRG